MAKNIHAQRILILDFGSQYTQLIARRVREIGVYCEIHACDMTAAEIEAFKPSGVILSGGPASVTAANTPRIDDIVFKLNVPVLGICYGMQAMAVHFGGEVKYSEKREFGFAEIKVKQACALLADIEDKLANDGRPLLDVWMSHGDHVTAIPEGFDLIASSSNAPLAVMANEDKHFYGVQFHPEVTHTRQGLRILENFILKICSLDALWTRDNIIDDAIKTIQKQVGKDHVILGLSGGVDSSVVAALLHKAIGSQLTCIFVDTGLLRMGEVEQVKTTFGKHFGVDLQVVDSQQLFFEALQGVDDPEEKRKIIGKLFIDVFDHAAKSIDGVKWLAQGTIYPDVIESAGAKSGKATVIKSHHNVGGLPETMKLQLLEPLRELFKDEVREIGLGLGLPYSLVYRHPFPGPGLAVRVLGEVRAEYVEMLRRADAIFIEELNTHELYQKVSQAFAVFLPVRSVGVMGDARQYEFVIALRAVETIDFMTATWAHLPYEFLGHVSNRIINEVSGISRVTYDISGKPPATIEWE